MKDTKTLIVIKVIMLQGLYALAAEDVPITYTNACQQSGQELYCEEGHVIHIEDVRCMPYNYSCGERDRISSLCNGLRSCARIGLRRQLHYYCKDFPNRNVIVSFQCIADPNIPLCRTNLCSNESRDIRCKRDKAIHIIKATCSHGDKECPIEVYMSLYDSCEGQRSCDMSTIRNRLPLQMCSDNLIQDQNVFLDYICVQESVILDTCSGTFLTISDKFGIFKSPGYPLNTDGNKNGCYWVIYPGSGQEVDVTVHLSFSKEGLVDCNARFLQVQFTDCATRRQRTDSFCHPNEINVMRHSCGTVYIMHWPYLPGEKRGNRFLVSFQVKPPGSILPSYQPFVHQCEKQPNKSTKTIFYPREVTTIPSNQDLVSIINDSTYKEYDVHTYTNVKPVSANSDQDKEDPWRQVTILRVVVANIFLGLLILGLVISLAYVCYRYKTFGKNTTKFQSRSNTNSSLDDKHGTRLTTLSDELLQAIGSRRRDENEVESHFELKTDSSAMTDETSFKTDIVYERPGAYVCPHYDRHGPFYEHAGVSSFLREEGADTDVHPYTYQTAINQGYQQNGVKEIKTNSLNGSPESCVKTYVPVTNDHEGGPLQDIRNSLQHYKINNDEYACVMKPARNRSGRDSNGSNHVQHHTRPVASVSPVPDPLCSKQPIIHLIPEHDCLLHKNLPPPPPPLLDYSKGESIQHNTQPRHYYRGHDYEEPYF
ncbi:hypothetical protein ACJMK2_024204 [Sinanodonta woodiana]|uniref:CUB domain-containing protein n=1 Tax=Sinanodonta woodiana TaxID=1069815 RepID=A0ABD3T7J3_SINWO